MAVATRTRQEILDRLAADWPYWSENVCKINAADGSVIPLIPKPGQLRVWEALEEQRRAGRPGRIIVPKARKEGVSTLAISLMVQRATQRANHNAISVAQDRETAGELLNLAMLIHARLPDSADWPIKPPIANKQRRKEIVFGNPSSHSQGRGDLGLNSRLLADTASEFEAGRGFTFHSVHASEAAFWTDPKRKLTSLLNAVPDDPSTLVILESTSNGHNHWRTLCMDALDGKNDFAVVFLPWFEEPNYVRGFLSEQERDEFSQTVGKGDYGDEEPVLIEEYGCTLEQLNWPRWAIGKRTQGDLRMFHQEYPTTLEQSFLSSGRHVFNQELVAKARRHVEAQPEPARGSLTAGRHRTVRHHYGMVEIPDSPVWEANAGGDWELWEQPHPDAQYVVAVDPAGDEVMDSHERAMHAVQVVNHRTGVQVAQLEAQGDADQIAVQIYLACLFYNRAWLAIETTGGWGLSMVRRIHKDFKYPFFYKRRRADAPTDTTEERLGYDTNRSTKVILEDGAKEMLREGTHGIRSKRLIRQFTTYVKDQAGRSAPAPGERSDLLMAWMIARQVAQEQTIKSASGTNGGMVSTTSRAVVNPKTGW